MRCEVEFMHKKNKVILPDQIISQKNMFEESKMQVQTSFKQLSS
jgi:hypothetical protein